MPIRSSACPLDCPDACTLSVTVEDGRVTAITGDERNPLTGGRICGNVRRFPQHVYGADRIRTPAIRTGTKGSGQYRDVTWDEALDRIAQVLRATRERFGGEAILPFCYGGSNGALTQDNIDARLFRRLGASRLVRTVCAAPSGAAAQGLYGNMPGVGFGDYRHARLIVIWGANPAHSGIHLMPPIIEAQRNGARLIVVDPRRTPVARRADRHLAVRPGTDLPLALSVIHRLFETGHADEAFLAKWTQGADRLRARAAEWPLDRAAEITGLSPDEIDAFAGEYSAASPAVIRCGYGLERNRNGGSAVAAVLAIPAVAGKFGVRGGGFTMSNGGHWSLDKERVIGEPEPATRCINMNRIGQALLEEEPPIRCLFVYNANPAVTVPNQNRVEEGLRREDLFTVVFDQVWTDTAQFADVVLPATTFLEHHELARGYGVPALRAAEPVIDRVGEARPNPEVFAELIERLGLEKDDDIVAPEAMCEAIVSRLDGSERIATELALRGVAVPEGGYDGVQLVDVLPRTPSSRIELFPEALDREAPSGLYTFRAQDDDDYPLTLISPATAHSISSSLAELREDPACLEMSSLDAESRGLQDGTAVRVFNRLGVVHCTLSVTDAVRAGVVVLPKGLWRKHTENGQTASALAPDSLTDLGQGACFNDARVEVARRVEASTTR
ncbi:MAG: molybdopterin-dependent oxidoreductase [Planctomycetota bacterium]